MIHFLERKNLFKHAGNFTIYAFYSLSTHAFYIELQIWLFIYNICFYNKAYMMTAGMKVL